MHASGNYELLIGKINQFIRKYYLNNLLRGLIFLGTGLFSAYIIIAIGEYYANFNTLWRTILFYLFILLNTGLLCWLVLPALLAWLQLGKTLTHDEAAEIIGKHFSDVSDKLLNTLQLKQLADDTPGSRQLIEASINQKIEHLKPVSFPSAVNLKENSRYLKWMIPPAAVICILALAAPSVLTESTRRLIRHNEYFAPLAPFQFVVMNNSLAAVQGDDLKLELKLTGNKLPADVYIETNGNTFKLDKENLSRFHYQFSNLQQNTSFRITANGYYSKPYLISVNLKPVLLNFDVRLAYPAYLHKKDEVIVNAGDLTLPAGTVATWQLHTQNTSGLLFTLNNKNTLLAADKHGLITYTSHITQNSSYALRPQRGQAVNGDAASYHINVITDEPPSINVEEKADSVSSKAIYFNGQAQDDHGFSSLTFHYYTVTGGKQQNQVTRTVKADLGQSTTNFFYFWDMVDLKVKPGDEVFYYFDVADNDAVAGAKHTRTPVRSLKTPTEKELNNQLNAGTQAVKQKMVSAIKLAGQLDKAAQKLNQLLVDKTSLSFDEKKQIEDLLQKKRDLNDLIKDIQAENQKNMYNRQENKQQSTDLTEKQKQMADLLKNVMDPETQQLLEKLQKLMDADQKEPTRDAVNKMQTDSRNLKKELDRMRELYKKLDFEQKLDETVNTLNKLADKQDALAAKTPQQQNSKQQLQQEQQSLSQEFKNAENTLDDLQKANQQLEDKSNFDNPQQQKQSIEQDMQQSSEGIEKNNRQKAAQSQKQAAGKMRQMAQKMQQSNQEGQEAQNSVDIDQLRGLLKNLVNSSFEQENVMQSLKKTYTTDPNYKVLAQKQKDIKDNLKTAEDSLYALSRRVPQIQSTVNTEINHINDRIDKTLENLADNRTAEAASNQQYAMMAMNNLALILSDALDHLQDMMKNGKAGKGKQQQSLQQLSRMQQQLNQNMQNMRDQMQQQQGKNQGQSQHQSQSEQLARMARAQQQIREQLEKINQDENKDGRNGLGDLGKIAKQMEQTERDLVNRKITDDAIKRQQQIQVKLLEAEKAEQQREQDQQRESKAGKEMPPGYIKALQSYQQTSAKQTEQLKTVPTALNLYYKQKIKSYFNQLNAK